MLNYLQLDQVGDAVDKIRQMVGLEAAQQISPDIAVLIEYSS